ncbi:MAG: nuclear transport factor 2 family protein [Gaiellaceae bacterium]
MNAQVAERLVRQYVEGWRQGDAAMILAAVTENCVVTESHGPTYRGRDQIARWVDTWFGAGGEVLVWEIRSLELADGAAFFEWSFACRWLGERYDFEGASVARFEESLISYIREYATTAPLYDWEGSWR